MPDELPSKTQRKKQMHDLQELGAEWSSSTDHRGSIELPKPADAVKKPAA